MAAPRPAEAALPPQGLYEQCAPNSTKVDCGERLKTMASAGFEYVLNYTSWFGSAQQVRRYADRAAALGIKLIWPLNDPAWRNGTDLRSHYRYLGPSCGCDDNAEFKRFAIDLVKDHPATWGFYVGDEVAPTPENVSQVAALSQEVKQLAPHRPTLYVALPREDLTQQLEPFMTAADVAGADYYPVGMAPDLSRVPSIARTTRQLADRYQRRSVLVLQAFSWSQYHPQVPPRFPTRDEMLRMRNLAIGHGDPDFVLWYAFNDVLESARPEANWSNLRAAAFTPHIRLSGAPRRCKRARFSLRVTVRAAGGLQRVRAIVDGRLVRKTTRESLRLGVRGRGRHKVEIVATDRSGHRAKQAARFRTCRR